MITIQKYVRAKSLEEAWTLNQVRTNRILGGMLWLRLGKSSCCCDPSEHPAPERKEGSGII
jgi:hypothetical protein